MHSHRYTDVLARALIRAHRAQDAGAMPSSRLTYIIGLITAAKKITRRRDRAAVLRLVHTALITHDALLSTIVPLHEKWEGVRRASEVAAHAHQGQVRAGAEARPYIVHPEEVVQILLEHGVDDPHIIAAAWLHDVVEDTSVTLADLAPFGPLVTDIVDRLTKQPHQLYAAYYQRIWESQSATLVKLADRISNLRSYHVKGHDKFQRYLAYTARDYTVRDSYGLWETLQDTLQQARAQLTPTHKT